LLSFDANAVIGAVNDSIQQIILSWCRTIREIRRRTDIKCSRISTILDTIAWDHQIHILHTFVTDNKETIFVCCETAQVDRAI